MKIKKEELYKLDAVEIYKMVLSGELKRFPQYFWEKPDSLNSAKKIVIWLLEKKLKLNDEQIKKEVSFKFFKDNKLGGMSSCLFNDSPYTIINNAYPNKFKPWELQITFKNYWNKETAKEAIKWLIEEKLQWNDNDIKKNLTVQIFYDNNLSGMIQTLFNGSPYNAINIAYPSKFKPWELIKVQDYWTLQTGAEAVKWLIEDKLRLTNSELKEKLSKSLFEDNGLSGMLSSIFNGSPYNAINIAYPGKFKKEEFKNYNYYKY